MGGLAHTATTIAASQRRRRRRAAPRSSVTFDAPFGIHARLVRIREGKLGAVEILDDQDPVTSLALLDRNAAGFELGAQRIDHFAY